MYVDDNNLSGEEGVLSLKNLTENANYRVYYAITTLASQGSG
jgi:hypothetical protein